MKKVFIAYADKKMAYSLKRIGNQAKSLGFFDEVILYTPDDIKEIRDWDLMQYSYGGGYWCWKPYIIYQTLQSQPEGTVVFYIDAGCSLKKGFEWDWLSRLTEHSETILFEYKSEMSEWGKFGSCSSKIKNWTKKSALEFYDRLTGSEDWRENNKIWGGCIIVRNSDNKIVEEWVDIIKTHPEVIIDPRADEEQLPYFAQHKHDQSLLVALSNKHSNKCLILPEFQETYGKKVIISASRIRAKTIGDYILHQMKGFFRSVIGIQFYNKIKAIIKR